MKEPRTLWVATALVWHFPCATPRHYYFETFMMRRTTALTLVKLPYIRVNVKFREAEGQKIVCFTFAAIMHPPFAVCASYFLKSRHMHEGYEAWERRFCCRLLSLMHSSEMYNNTLIFKA